MEARQNHAKSVLRDSSEINSEKQFGGRATGRRDYSVDITKDSSEVLRLLNILKQRKAQREKKAWIPAGPLHRYDGHNPAPKVYY